MKRRRGFALMAALWLLIAISAVSLELSVLARSRRLAAANSLESTQAQAAAESGIEHARARLARAIAEGGTGRTWGDAAAVLDPWHSLHVGLADSARLGPAAWYQVTLTDLGGQININRVVEDDLRRFLTAHEVDAAVAEGIAESILDWRDPDDFRRLRGAEREDYMKAGARELPRNGPFESVDELRFVQGMTPALLARLRGELTIFGGGQINLNVADRAVLLSLPGITPLAADLIVRFQRSGRLIQTMQQLTDLLPSEARAAFERSLPELLPRVTFDTHEVLATSDGWLTGSPVRVRERAVLARGGSAVFVTWRQVE
jgi:general secretion pathway protein K